MSVAFGSSASHSVPRAVANGPFSLIARHLARLGLPTDGPIKGTRARVRVGSMGLLSLTALTFATLKNARSSEVNDVVPDEDSISFRQMPHGVLELVTKESVPRYLTVDDPGETIVLSKSGSAISVSQTANSAARMEELQTAQQEVHANQAKGLGPGGSGTTPFSDTLPVQPINFTQPDGPATLNSLPALPAVETKAEFIYIPPPAPEPATLTLALGTTPVETDTVVFDTFAATSGIFTATSSSGAGLTYGISGGTPGNTVLNGVTYNLSQEGEYGTLYLDSTTGAYTFVPDDPAINALKAPTTESFVVTVTDGAMTASETFTVDIHGVNDDAIIAGNVTGSVSEAPGVAAARFAAAHAQPPRVATGTLTSNDVDDASNTFTEVASPTPSNGGYGTFTITEGGLWTYTLDDGNGAVQALNAGDTLIDTFTVTTIDGTEQTVTIVIGGRNDAAIISGDTTGSVIEAVCKDPGIPVATGTLSATDVDNPSDSFTSVKCGQSNRGYGTFTMTKDGVWTYTLDNDNCVVQALDDCDTLTDTFTVTTEDGTEQVVTVIIQGADDGHGRHHHRHSDHEKSAFKTSTASSFDVEAGSAKLASESSDTMVATQADTDAGLQSVSGLEPAPATPRDVDGSFQFKDDWGPGSPDLGVVPDFRCFLPPVVDIPGAPDAVPDGLLVRQVSEPPPPERDFLADSFQFKERIGSQDQESDAVVGCFQPAVDPPGSPGGVPDMLVVRQVFEGCPPDGASVPDQQRGNCHLSHDLVV